MPDYSRTITPITELLAFIKAQLAAISEIDVDVQTFYGGNDEELFNYNIMKPEVKPVALVSQPDTIYLMEPQAKYRFFVYIITRAIVDRATAFTDNQGVIAQTIKALDFKLYPETSPVPLGSPSLIYANKNTQVVIKEKGGTTIFKIEFIIEDN